MYAETVFPDRYQSCGVTLRPLTLGHALLLSRMKSPLAKSVPVNEEDGSIFSFTDALLCAYVCSRSWQSARDSMETARASVWLRWKTVTRRWKAQEDRLSLLLWHQAMWKSPAFDHDNTEVSSRQCGAEWLHQLRVFACDTLNCTPLSALEQPVATLQYDWICHMERKGLIRITEEENDLIVRLSSEIKGASNV